MFHTVTPPINLRRGDSPQSLNVLAVLINELPISL
jgi:hypothetical protein